MLSGLARLFQQVDIFFAEGRVRMRGIVRVDQLRQAQGAGHTCRATADNHNIGFHLRTFDAFDGLTEVDHEGATLPI